MIVGAVKDEELKLRGLHASHTHDLSHGVVYLQLDKKRRRPRRVKSVTTGRPGEAICFFWAVQSDNEPAHQGSLHRCAQMGQVGQGCANSGHRDCALAHCFFLSLHTGSGPHVKNAR
jgi:hypothetical protein